MGLRYMLKGFKKIRIFTSTVLICSLIASCQPQAGKGSRKTREGDELTQPPQVTPGAGNGQGAGSGTNNSSLQTIAPSAELRHLIDPFDGTFKAKLTLPKNFRGYLYLSGLNINSLKDKLIHVRFNFGRELEPITVPASIQTVPGLTPQTDIEVLALSFNSPLFQNIRLIYDLYDYNTYTASDTPTVDPRDGGLYCRGLKLEHDPTFLSSNNDTLCNETGERCLYAYAKVVDKGLVNNATNIATIPTEPNLALSLADFTSPGDAVSRQNNLKKCLPDNGDLFFNANGGDPFVDISQTSSATLGSLVHIVNSVNYAYDGPYRPISKSTWEISGNALIADNVYTGSEPSGLFMRSLDGTPEHGILSFLFPRAGKMNLTANTDYLGSSNALGTITASTFTPDQRTRQTLLASGKTQFMDGCSLRVSNYDSFINEGIHSCNITATIQLLTIDQVTGVETIITSSKDLKLQLTRASLTNFEGQEVLYSSMKTCSSSKACGAGECCFNSRCWSKDVVSQCLEDVNANGNFPIGDSCQSDFQCASLCCSRNTLTCQVHDTTSSPQVLCSKRPGETCVAKEWCRKDNVQECLIVKTGIDNNGQTTCALRCFNKPTNGECRNGLCIAPTAPPIPVFDPSNPDCTNAVDPPSNPPTP